ncbi:Eco57I restriction-modification methylase domain-containing protein [Streptomyces arboris]|uniref:site-specific DNA-methyltransferase (adenine-specific) n=1 Tax=Streptomyces arboris TaxID=2600619 RepID=A0A5N5EN95_9ACTN|nr:DNA methyltransferase [Streptomyces arboris]KAB2590162.1 class I SAM-dependent DNA methyltransferase [Streptomyces arboris]
MTFDSLINEREYFPSFYLDDILPKQLASGPLKQWSARERQGEATPRQNLRDLTRPYMDVRAVLAPDAEKYNGLPFAPAVAAQAAAAAVLKAVGPDTEPPAFQPLQEPEAEADSTPEGEWRGVLDGWHERLLKALDFVPRPGHFTARTPTGPIAVPVAHSEPGVVVLAGGFAEDLDATRGDGPANLLAAPVRLSASKTLTTVRELASWVLNADNAPRYALLLFGGVLILADKQQFSRGRYLAVNLDTALPRKAAKGARANEIDLIAAVFAASSLRPAEDGSDDEIAKLVAESRDHSVGVTAELRVGLQKSVQLIANEVLGRARTEFEVHPDDLPEWLPGALPEHGDLPRLLTEESLRYLYRILFLLYAEARPELDILPVKSEAYASGYSVARLRELVVQEKLGSASRDGFHFHESLSLLFEKVFSGHPVANTVTDRNAPVEEAPELAEDDGHESVRIEALRSRLFDPTSIKLVGQRIDYPEPTRRDGSPAPATPLDLRLRNKVLHQVLRHLTLVEGKGKGRGGFISYANLSINHLGAVYEGLMSYTGFIAEKPMYEVAKGGNPEGGSWLITTDQVRSGLYSDAPGDSVFVKKDAVNPETGVPDSVVHEVGSYVYRLAGRDRQTSASYYTPESLTRATVEQTLRFRLDDEGRVDPREPEKSGVTAAEVLRWRVCEPALGSGAFLNEAVNQLAELYLKLAQKERGEQIDPEEYPREFQKAKAYIALHNAYGVDLNRTAVELAEISLWLNTMYPGMRAPWYGLHLHRGNSLIGAARKVYPGKSLGDGGWLKSSGRQAPKAVPLTEALGGSGVHRPVHQFLLPALGWGSVGDSVSVRKATGKSVVAGAVAEWLDPSLIEAMRKWRSAMRRAPKGEKRASASVSASTSGKAATNQTAVLKREERTGQGALDLGLDIWEQSGFDFAAASAADAAPAPAKRVASSAAGTNADDGSYGQTGRLRALAERVEYLWGLVRLRLELSEQEISRDIPVWGAERDGKRSAPVMDREAVLEALEAPGSPYWRLKQVMDAWCALWFWPLEEVALLDGTAPDYFNGAQDLKKLGKGTIDRKVALRNLDEWIEFAESVVGRVDVEPGKDAGSLFEMPKVNGLKGLDAFERTLDDKMTEISGWVDFLSLGDLFPWHGTAVRIARERGFLHWELDFAHVFAGGGFDLMVGNPPWVRQEWDESGVLAELEPWFELNNRGAEKDRAERVEALLRTAHNRSFYLEELETVAGVSSFLSGMDTYPELVGTRPDMYRAFMLLVWRAAGEHGTAGLVHPSSHLTGAKEGALRKATYRHLRLHADFENQRSLFAKPVGHSRHFSVNVYGNPRQAIRFQHISWLFAPETLSESVRDKKDRPLPGLKHNGKWDIRPHRSRVLVVDKDVLTDWRKLANETDAAPLDETRLLFPVTTAEGAAIAALAKWPHRLEKMVPRISAGFNEKTDRTAGYFTWKPGRADTWADVILQGPMFGVATPFLRKAVSASKLEMWGSADLEETAVQYTNYRPAGSRAKYVATQDRWVDHGRLKQLQGNPTAVAAAEQDVRAADPELDEDACKLAVEALLLAASMRPYSDFYRVAWREMIASDTERSLYAAVIPRGANHVNAVRSCALASSSSTVLAAGFFASLSLDYLLRSSGHGHLDVSNAKAMPAPTPGHPLEHALLLRTLRLNAQTNAYASLWEELYSPDWQQDSWAAAARWPDGTPPLAEGVGPTWTRDTPLRAEFARRAALVEIDALVAVWLGISADELVAMYRARFPVLQQYEENMWFDATGRRIAKAHQQHGYGQPKDAWKQLSSHEDFPLDANVPDGYEGPLYRANRVEEMRAAHAEFTRRMRAVGWEPGDTEPPASAEQ